MQTVTVTRLEAINIRRRRAGLTQSELGVLAGYSESYGMQVLKGANESEQALDRMEAALDAAESASTEEVSA